MTIHPAAIIADGADIHESAEIGPGAVIGANVKIGRGTKVGPHVVIDGHTQIGEDCEIFAGAIIGLPPQDRSYKGEPSGVLVGDRCVIREYATIHRATGDDTTIVGEDAFLMNYAHVAHNCKLGKGVTMANNATIAGYVQIGDFAVLSGMVVVHQHSRIGRLCMLSGLTGARQDLPPFTNLDGRPSRVRGINMLGLRRIQAKPEVRSAIKETYRLIYRSGLNISQALDRVETDLELFPEVKEIVEFFRTSKRGVAPAFVEHLGDDEATTTVKEQGVFSESGVSSF